ncbi:glycosyltransferase family 4 protein [Martelella limonii]|uniref:glycosyltransferase family 4 protein n=1 Tax=Martelella limonii TaxID=1647649 RepID=UPI00158056E6|nr:glycosyltransferase family 4 protein [Martelella limonii]
MSSAIAVIDPYCLTPYTLSALESGALSGAEAISMRVARIQGSNFRFHFYQNGRNDIDRDSCGFYRPIEAMRADDLAGVQAIVVISSWKAALKARRLNPHCPIMLRLHSNPGRHNRRMGNALADADIEIVCVSKSHARHVREFLSAENERLPKISSIYNPVDDTLLPNATQRDRNRMFFPGTPLKGMSEVLTKFELLRQALPELRLDIAEAGNMIWPDGKPPAGVTFLGRLEDDEMIDQMRRSLCIFYPQTRYQEPFGLPLAEANAVGTPVIADEALDINREILGAGGQCIDTSNLPALAGKIEEWQKALPVLPVSPQFRLSAIAAIWARKLTGQPEARAFTNEGATGIDIAAPAGPSR